MQVGAAVPEGGAALEGQQVHRHCPALPLVAQHPIGRHEHVVEEDLAELLASVDRGDRSHGDAGRVHVDEQRGDAPVGGVGAARAGEQHAPLRELRQARPDLLPVHGPAVVDPRRRTGEGGQVAAGAGLGEALAPRLVAAELSRHHLGRQLGAGVVDHGRHQHLGHRVDAGLHQAAGGEGLTEVATQQRRPSQAPDRLGPAAPHPAGVVGEALHLRQVGHAVLERLARRAGDRPRARRASGRVRRGTRRGPSPSTALSALGAGRVGSCGRPESRLPLFRRNVIERVCRRQPSSVRR